MFSIAYAAEGVSTAGAGLSGTVAGFVPFAVIMVIFYVLVFMPQQRKIKEHKSMISSIKEGDTIVTAGGLVGKVRPGDNALSDGTAILTIEVNDGVAVKVSREMILKRL